MYDFIVVESPLLPPGVRMAQVGQGSRLLTRHRGLLDMQQSALGGGCSATQIRVVLRC